jgi:error-prone DNA polymerase
MIPRDALRAPQDEVTAYSEIAVTTNFSFLHGASHPKELAEQATRLGLSAIGITDRNSLAGVVRAYSALKEIKPQTDAPIPKLLVGARLVFVDGTPDILAYPEDRAAYGRLCRLLSEGKMRAPKGECILTLKDLSKRLEGLLLVVLPPQPGKTSVEILPPEKVWNHALPAVREQTSEICFAAKLRTSPSDVEALLNSLSDMAPGRVWLGVTMPRLGKDERRLAQWKTVARATNVPLIATNDVLYHAPERRALQDVVTCIREHVTLEEAGRRLEINAERHLKSPADMATLFRNAPETIVETIRFSERIRFSLDQLKYNYPDEPVPKGKTADEHLTDLAWKGAHEKYPGGIPDKVCISLGNELALIRKMQIAPYFLTVHDIVRIAEEKGILCQGRGSAANSAVCYMLGITSVNPMEIDLLFERFISEERKEPPDIDVDFEHERREEIIQDIYNRYGHGRAALTATVICYRPRSTIRDVGKVFGLTEDVTSALVSGLWGSGDSDSWGEKRHARMREGGFEAGNPVVERAAYFADELCDFPRHLSQHVGGFVLTKDRLDEIVPVAPATMKDRFFIEWDKDDIDALRMMKVDVLALGMLTCIRKAFDLIKTHEHKTYTLATVPKERPEVYDMLCGADAIGVFQVESRAQMSMLPRLKPKKFYDLVIEVAIVRPGPIQGNMVHPYLRRRGEKESVSYPSPSPEHGPPDELYKVLNKTLGIPLFQEQAMKLAIVAAEFTSEEANGLRRAMATFRNVGTIGSFEKMMIERMVKRGYERTFAQNCFNQIKGFGSYGFPESHAASFALLVYVSAWIKKFHPAAFATALLNSQPMGFYAPAEIVRDAQEHGVEARHVDVNRSEWDNILESSPGNPLALRLGFRQIDGFSEEWWTKFINPHRGNGFSNFDSFVRRTKLPKRALIVLAEADCFRSLGLDRRESLWMVRRLPDDDSLPLFSSQFVEDLPEESIAPLPVMPLGEHVLADYRMLRLSLRAHLMQFLRDLFREEGVSSCAEIASAPDGMHATCAGIVLVRQMPGDAGVVFVTLSDETKIANVVVWPRVFEQFRREVMGARLLLVEGKVQRSPENVVHLVAERFIDRTAELDRLSEDRIKAAPAQMPGARLHRHPRNMRTVLKSRDFH